MIIELVVLFIEIHRSRPPCLFRQLRFISVGMRNKLSSNHVMSRCEMMWKDEDAEEGESRKRFAILTKSSLYCFAVIMLHW